MQPEAPRPQVGDDSDAGSVRTVAINGETRPIAPGMTVAALLRELELPEDRVAVELNGEILRRPKWSATEPPDGARLEIVHFVGGG